MTLQKKATLVASSTATLLAIFKLVLGIASGSVALLASAVDSVLDMLISIFNYYAINKSEKPADKEFNYGHGKIEALASVIEGTIIAVSGLFLIYQAIKKYITGEVSSYIGISLFVMVISFIATYLLVKYLENVADKTDNMVIKADALHYKTDLYSNGAVLVSLGLVYFTHIELIDIIVGLGIAFYIIYSAYELIEEGVLVLLDRAIDEDITTQIKDIIAKNEFVKDYHFFKTREAGNQYFVDVHLVFTKATLLIDAHNASDEIEEEIEKLEDKKEWIFSIHLDPYDDSI